MSEIIDMFENYFSAYKNTSEYKDSCMLEIVVRKKEFEENLDNMWRIYSKGVSAQIIDYNKGVKQIKDAGLKILRNSDGLHKIIIPK